MGGVTPATGHSLRRIMAGLETLFKRFSVLQDLQPSSPKFGGQIGPIHQIK